MAQAELHGDRGIDLRASRAVIAGVAFAGSAMVAATVVVTAATAGITAWVLRGAMWALWLLLLVVVSRRHLHVDEAGVSYSDGLRRHHLPWSDVERVEVVAPHRVLRRPRIVGGGRRVRVPSNATWASAAGLSPLDRITALAGEHGVPVVAARSRARLWLWAGVIVAGVATGIAVGTALAAVMI